LASHSYFFKFDKVVASLLKSSEGRELLKRGSDLVCLKEKRTLLMQTLKITEDQCGSQKDWDQSSDFMSSEFERPHGLPTLTSYPFIANDLAELRAYANAQVGDIAVIQQRLHEDQSRFLVHLYEMTRRENPWTPTEVTPPLSTDALKAALSPH